VARFFGCPIPDSDHDGVNDEEDKCPAVAGVKENQGCPLDKASNTTTNDTTRYTIYFEPGKNILRSEGFDVLNKIVQLMKQNKALVVTCVGHTDNVGNKIANYNLSLSRAAVCQSYITSFYIGKERVNIVGLGSTMPAADLSDPLQQWKNRRTEILVYQRK
jgi:outer membrane protein OmpA-like peptidoglycan-associated protein